MPGSVFDGLGAGDKYTPAPAVAQQHDFFFAYATVPFNQAGVVDGGSIFLNAVCAQLREHPRSSFPDQIRFANGQMSREHGGGGSVMVDCYPQCAQVTDTLTKALHFPFYIDSDADSPSETALREVMDLLYTCASAHLPLPHTAFVTCSLGRGVVVLRTRRPTLTAQDQALPRRLPRLARSKGDGASAARFP